MKVQIALIKITDRIRKEINKIDELAADIEANGLLNPITVMSIDGGEFRLLAGLRRLRAVEKLGYAEIDVNVVSPADAEMALRMEISENEQREPFTYTEKMDFARILEEIEEEKAKARKLKGQSLGGTTAGRGRSLSNSFVDTCPQSYWKKKDVNPGTREIVGRKIDMSGRQYARAKYIAKNAPVEIIDELDKGKRKIGSVYKELRKKEEAKQSPIEVVQLETMDDTIEDFSDNSSPAPNEAEAEIESSEMELPEMESLSTKHEPDAYVDTASDSDKTMTETTLPKPQPNYKCTAGSLPKTDEEAVKRNKDFNALAPLEKIKELQRQLKEERVRATHAESELARLKELRHNDIYHRDGIINNLKERLAEAEARIEELEKSKRE